MKTILRSFAHLTSTLSTLTVLFSLAGPAPGWAQGTAFGYQGRLADGGSPANGLYDLEFTVFDAITNGTLVAGPLTNTAVAVTNGLFAVTLDFGAGVFTGASRFLEIGARTNGTSLFTTLTPRQALTAVPYALLAGDVTGANVARLNVPNTATQATGHPIVTSGFITSAIVDSPGSGYLAPPQVTVNDSTGAGAILVASITNGSVSALAVNNPGSGYSSGATLTIAVPPSNAYQVFSSTNFFSSANFLTNGNNVFGGNGAGLTNLNAWKLNGNSGTSAANFLGTTDNQPLELRVNSLRGLRLEPTTNTSGNSNLVNVIGGSPVNFSAPGVYGATIGGGGALNYSGFGLYPNIVNADLGTIGGGLGNQIQLGSTYSAIAGGLLNRVTNSPESTISGGYNNVISISGALLGSGNSTIAGGLYNEIGQTNPVSSALSDGAHFIGGGYNNRIGPNLLGSTIAGGLQNIVQAPSGSICGGANNVIEFTGGTSAIAGGRANTNSGNFAAIPGGEQNAARGDYSFATGRRAKANHEGAFVWADSQNADFASTSSNQFLIRASGGVGIGVTAPDAPLHVASGSAGSVSANANSIAAFEKSGTGYVSLLGPVSSEVGILFGNPNTNTDGGVIYNNPSVPSGLEFRTGTNNNRMVILANGNVGIGLTTPTNKLHVAGDVSATVFVTTSDRNAKENFEPVSPASVLEKVAALPITCWTFKELPGAKHLGPMAQDFHAAFGLGSGETGIATVDESGVALAAIQALNQKLEDRTKDLEQTLKCQTAENAALKERLGALEKVIREQEPRISINR